MGKKSKLAKIPVNVQVPARDVVESCICNLECREIKELIVQLEREVADYDFTEELAKYFIKELRSSDPYNFDINKLLED